MKAGDIVQVTAAMQSAFDRMQEASIRAQEASNTVDKRSGERYLVDATLDFAVTVVAAYNQQDDAEVLRDH